MSLHETGLQLQQRLRHFIIRGSSLYDPVARVTITVIISLYESEKRIETKLYRSHEKRNN
jgi:hypothetical protein